MVLGRLRGIDLGGGEALPRFVCAQRVETPCFRAEERIRVMRSAATIVRAAATAFLLCAGSLQAASVGSKAPALEPSEWLNTKSSLSWSALQGRVVLIEKWATF